MKAALVLAMHGMPPHDFPKAEMAEYFSQYNPFHHQGPQGHSHAPSRFQELDVKMRQWPRNPQNDTFFGAAYQLADRLKEATGYPVIVGFNEFCAPNLDSAMDQAAGQGDTVVVITPMMTPGGIHSEVDIPMTIQRAQARHPAVRFEYVWPFDLRDVAGFLKGQIAKTLEKTKASL
jgi:sirohydrochlorin cobaltochelatase